MLFTRVGHALVACLLSGALSAAAGAAGDPPESVAWLLGQIASHPDIVAARERLDAAWSSGEDRAQPLYNPSLTSELEREGEEENYRLGLSQTIDWWDKRGVRREQGESLVQAARAEYALTYQETLGAALDALVTVRASRERYRLAREQEAQLDTLIALVRQRQQVGDLGQIDGELALLSLSQRLNATAESMAEYQAAQAQLRQWLPDWRPDREDLPPRFWQLRGLSPDPTLVDSHPRVRRARARWESRRRQAELARLEARPEPTVAINAGRNEGENVVAFNLSVPLNIRNRYSARTRAASEQANAAEADYRAVRRRQIADMAAAEAVMRQYHRKLGDWRELLGDRRDRSRTLLETQWRTGDLSTTDYLQALEQRRDGLLAGIALEENFRLALVDWLRSSGRLPSRTQPLKTPSTEE